MSGEGELSDSTGGARPAAPGGSGGADTADAALALLAWGLALLGVALLVVSEVWLNPRPGTWPVASLAVVAAGLAAVRLARRVGLPDGPDARPGRGRGRSAVGWSALRYLRERIAAAPVRAALTVLGLAAGAVAVAMLHALGDDHPSREYRVVFAVWAAGIVLYAAGMTLPARPPGRARALAWIAANRAALLDATGLFAIALVLRVVALDALPDVVTGDEGVFGNAAVAMAQGEGGHMFGTYWANGMLYIVPHAVLAWLFGPTIWTLRLPTAVLGAAAVPFAYLSCRGSFGRLAGLAAGTLLAVSHLHVHVSRMGLGHGIDGFLAAVAGWGLLAGIARRDVRPAVASGIALGVAQHVYVGARLIDVVVLVFVVLLAALVALKAFRAIAATRLAGRQRGDPAPAVAPVDPTNTGGPGLLSPSLPLAPIAAAFGASLITAGPMIRWAIVRRDDYLARLNAQGLVQSGKAAELLDESSPWQVVLKQLQDSILAFVGAPANAFYFSETPMLTAAWAALLVLGLALALRFAHQPRMLLPLLFVTGGGTLLALAAHTSTSAYRIASAMPAIAVLSGLALSLLGTAVSAGGRGEVEVGRGEDEGIGSITDGHMSGDAARGAAASAFGRIGAGPGAAMAAVVVVIAAAELWAYFGAFRLGCAYWDDRAAAASSTAIDIARRAEGASVLVLPASSLELGSFESVKFLTQREIVPAVEALPSPIFGAPEDGDSETSDAASPQDEAARLIYEVPEGYGTDAMIDVLRSLPRPLHAYAAPERIEELDAVLAAVAASSDRPTAGGASDEFDLQAEVLGRCDRQLVHVRRQSAAP